MKNLNINWRNTVFAAIATIVFLFAASSFAVAQDQPTFKPGDRVEVDGTGIGWWTKATVTKIDIIDGVFFGYWVKLDNGRETRIGKKPEDIRPLKAAEKQAENQPEAENKTKKQPPTENQTGRFKVGDRVLASPMALKEDEYFEKCTVIKDYMETEGADAYKVRCDDPKGGKGTEANVKVPYIRAWANATPPPATPDCQFNEPAGTVSKTSKPSAQLFQRVIFERYRDNAGGRKVGITYQTFQLGKSYVNRLTNNGLLHDGAPQGATIYTVKTKYIFCERYTDSTIRWVTEAQYSCFKDKFGDWVCPSDSTKNLEQIYLPNK